MCGSCDYYAYYEEDEVDLLINGSLTNSVLGKAEDDSLVYEETDDLAGYTFSSEESYTVDSESNFEVDFTETPETEVLADTSIESDAIETIIAASDRSSTESEQSVEDIELETIELFRFRNTTFDTGTYIFVGKEERDSILEDENLRNTFELDGVGEDGTINPAFIASATDGDDLAPVYRLKNLDTPGTFLFVGQAEYDAIFEGESDQRSKWEKEGFDEAGEVDIPEFYLYEGSANLGTEFNRFQNTQNNTFLYAGGAEAEAILNDPNLSNVFQNQGVAFEFLD